MEVPIDIYLLVGLVFLSVVSTLLLFGVLIWKFLRSPEFRMRLRKKKWVYAIVKNKLGELKEYLIPLDQIEKVSSSFKISGGTYFWRSQDKLGRQTVFPYKKKLGAIFRRGIPFPEAFAESSLDALGGYTSEEFTTILESEVERNIVEAMRPHNIPYAIMIGVLLIAIIASTVYLGMGLNALTAAQHAAANGGGATAATNSTSLCPPGYVYIGGHCQLG